MLKSRILRVLFASASIALAGLAPAAHADYPDRPIKLIMPYAAGAGAMDLAIVAKLESAVMEVFTDPATKAELAKAGIEVAPLDRKAFGAKMAADLITWESTLKGVSVQ